MSRIWNVLCLKTIMAIPRDGFSTPRSPKSIFGNPLVIKT